MRYTELSGSSNRRLWEKWLRGSYCPPPLYNDTSRGFEYDLRSVPMEQAVVSIPGRIHHASGHLLALDA